LFLVFLVNVPEHSVLEVVIIEWIHHLNSLGTLGTLGTDAVSPSRDGHYGIESLGTLLGTNQYR